MNIWRKLNKKNYRHHVDPDEIFLDAQNLPEFNTQQFEGVIERPISKRTVIVVGILCAVITLIFIVRLGVLQIARGEAYYERSESNYIYNQLVFGDRGIIFDRNGETLAWNVLGENNEPFSYRTYIDDPGFAHILGYVKYPKKDSSGVYWRTELEGVEGVEARYEDTLRGIPGSHMVEVNAKQEVVSSGKLEQEQDGENITLTIDAGLQTEISRQLAVMAKEFGYQGGAGIIMDVHSGDLLALTSYPEYDPEIISRGTESDTISQYFNDRDKPMLNRAVAGLYTPGSIVKPFFALGALNEHVITPSKKILSTGYIEIPNPYDPDNPSRFYDWRWSRYNEGHGWTDVYHAIADSVNTYMYAIGGGYQDQEGIGIAGIEKYARKFKLAEPTGWILGNEKEGTIPTPEWKEELFDGDDWRLGDTYNTVIGQFGFQVTPLSMVRAVTALANDGVLLTPRVMQTQRVETKNVLGVEQSFYQVIRDAMRQTVTEGTATSLDVGYVKVAAKTGTAQTNGNRNINAWAVGFFPYEAPRYAFVFLAEGASSEQRVGVSYAVRHVLDWMNEHTPEYFEVSL